MHQLELVRVLQRKDDDKFLCTTGEEEGSPERRWRLVAAPSAHCFVCLLFLRVAEVGRGGSLRRMQQVSVPRLLLAATRISTPNLSGGAGAPARQFTAAASCGSLASARYSSARAAAVSASATGTSRTWPATFYTWTPAGLVAPVVCSTGPAGGQNKQSRANSGGKQRKRTKTLNTTAHSRSSISNSRTNKRNNLETVNSFFACYLLVSLSS